MMTLALIGTTWKVFKVISLKLSFMQGSYESFDHSHSNQMILRLSLFLVHSVVSLEIT